MNEEGLPHLREVILFLTLAGVLIPLLKRLRINPVLGFLTVGILVGPHGLSAYTQDSSVLRYLSFPELKMVEVFAEIGVIFLLFMIGLHLSFERLWHLRRWVFGAGIAQMAITILVIGVGLLFFQLTLGVALLVGAVLSFSSTAIVMKLLEQNRQNHTPMGRGVFSVLLLQDLAVVPLLLLLESISERSSSLPLIIGMAAGKAFLVFALIYWVGKKGLSPLFRTFADTKEPESFVALVLLTVLGIAAITSWADLSMGMGALLAGLLLAETEFRHEIEVIIKPFSGLLMGLFFFSMGMKIDVPGIVSSPLMWIGLALALYGIKALIAIVVLKAFGLSKGASVEGGILLGQGSEFAFIALGIATAHQVFSQDLVQSLTIIISITLLLTPLLSIGGHYWHNHWSEQALLREMMSAPHAEGEQSEDARNHALQALSSKLRNHVVILGYGRVGQVLGKLLYQNAMSFVAIDNNARHSAFFFKHGLPVYFGNEQHPEMLRAFSLDRALCVVLTMNNREGSLKVVSMIRKEYPQLPIFARAHDETHARALIAAGVKEVILETFEASLQLTQTILRESGLGLEQLQTIITKEREQRIQGMVPSPEHLVNVARSEH